jgi:hypothetical protein
MKKSLAEYMDVKEEKDELKAEVKDDKDMEFGDMRTVYLFEKVFDGGPCEGTQLERTMKRIKCLKELLAALK